MNLKKLLITIIAIVISLSSIACGTETQSVSIAETTAKETRDASKPVKVGIAWRVDNKPKLYEATSTALGMVGADAVILDQVVDNDLSYAEKQVTEVDSNGVLTEVAATKVKTNTYKNSNVEQVMSGIEAVVFLGGEDISTTLIDTPITYEKYDEQDTVNATRDVSDYLLMKYCLDNDIPIMCICRGMQMLAIISGGSMIQDIPTYYNEEGVTYGYVHRMKRDSEGNIPDFIPHSISILDKDSFAYKIFKSEVVEGIPSWHHQMVTLDNAKNIKLTATFTDSGITVPEIIERTDVTYAVGYQFHPEAPIQKQLGGGNTEDFMSISTSLDIFDSFVKSVQ